MTRTSITAAVLATALVGCGYEPAPDGRSDPLSSAHRSAVEDTLEETGAACNVAGEAEAFGISDDPTSHEVKTLTRVARKRPHGVYRPRGIGATGAHVDQGALNGDTMIQVMERAAHKVEDCLPARARELTDVTQQLRSVPPDSEPTH